MSKKSYKRHQNRLYREIKRRMLLEKMPVPRNIIAVNHRKIDTLKVRKIIPCETYREVDESYEMYEMIKEIAKKLYEDQYVVFHTHHYEPNEPIRDCVEIEARIDVVMPADY